jgi:hypothetical protein
MATFILVHGTFARSANWAFGDSPLRERLKSAANQHGQPARFIPVAWSGRNSGKDRLETANALKNHIEASRSEASKEPIFLIGHSHGGSAIAYLLNNFSDLRDVIAGCAFLSTPFVALRIRRSLPELVTAIAAAVGVLGYVLAAGLASYILHTFRLGDREGTAIQAVLVMTMCFVIAVAIAIWILVRIAGRARSALQGKLERRIAENETASISRGPHLFLRASGDEAATVLSASQFMAWAMGTLAGLSTTIVLRVRSTLLWMYGSLIGRIALVAFCLLFAAWLCFLFLLRLEFGNWGFLFDMFATNWTMDPLGPIGIAAEYTMRGLWPVFLFLLGGTLIYALILLLTLAIGALTLRVFGWTNFLEAVFADFSVEPTPYGRVDFVHLDWKDQDDSLSELNHSRTYLNPRALDCLEAWVSSRIGALSATPVHTP